MTPEPLRNIRLVESAFEGETFLTASDGQRFIKVHFPTDVAPPGPVAERMWVKVKSFKARSGVLDSEPIACPYVKLGEVVEFIQMGDKFIAKIGDIL